MQTAIYFFIKKFWYYRKECKIPIDQEITIQAKTVLPKITWKLLFHGLYNMGIVSSAAHEL